jgi:thiopeptide-type bacteriocin biosynthesis protein
VEAGSVESRPGPQPGPGTWHSLHVHRYGLQDEFLLDGLAPVLESLRASGALTRWFFLRYWQGGHHVRVRLRLADAEAELALAEAVKRFESYLAVCPGGRDFDTEAFHQDAQPTMAALEGELPQEIRPPDTVWPAVYEPEYGKYGGVRGVAIAEEYFHRSSDVALAALRTVSGASGKRLGAAFTMMLRGLRAAGMPPAAMADFFAHYCLVWAPYVFDQFLATWPELLARRRQPMRTHAAAVLTAGPGAADPFSCAVRQAWGQVGQAAAEVLPEVTLAGPAASRQRRGQVLLVSYLHTHNNRLGLIPEQEAFLSYLAHHVLSECAGTAPRTDLPQAVRDRRRQRLPG